MQPNDYWMKHNAMTVLLSLSINTAYLRLHFQSCCWYRWTCIKYLCLANHGGGVGETGYETVALSLNNTTLRLAILYDNVGELALSLFITVTDLCLASHVGGVGELGYVPVALSFFWTDDGQSQLLSRVWWLSDGEALDRFRLWGNDNRLTLHFTSLKDKYVDTHWEWQK